MKLLIQSLSLLDENSGETPHFKQFLSFQVIEVQVETCFTKCSGCD